VPARGARKRRLRALRGGGPRPSSGGVLCAAPGDGRRRRGPRDTDRVWRAAAFASAGEHPVATGTHATARPGWEAKARSRVRSSTFSSQRLVSATWQPLQLAHPTHDRLAAGSEPAACEADRVTQLPECSVVVEGFGRTGLPDFFERSVNTSELLKQADVGVLARPWLDVLSARLIARRGDE